MARYGGIGSLVSSSRHHHSASCSMVDILDTVKCEEMFAFIQCIIHIRPHLIDKFSEFPPIFKNTEISMTDIGEHMHTAEASGVSDAQNDLSLAQ